MGPDSRLDLAALTIQTLRPAPALSAPPAPAPAPAPPARPAADAADAAFEGSGTSQAVFNPLKYYRKMIGRYPLLSRQQEAELAQAIEAGLLAQEKLDKADRKIAPELRREFQQIVRLGEQAFTDFVQANLRLVVNVATWYAGRGLDLMDLIQEGNLGLLRAIEKFDHRKGFKFSSYAVPHIRQSILRAIADQSRTVRLPVHAHDTVAALHKAARELRYDAPADALSAVAALVGIPVVKAAELLAQVRRTVPLEELTEAIGDDALHEEADRSTSGPHLLEPDAYYRNLSPEEVHSVLSCLTEREHRILTLRHGLDGGPELTLDAIGRDVVLTRERVRQIEAQAMEKLRELIHEYQNPQRPLLSSPPVAEPCTTAPTEPSVDLADELHVTRKVHYSGQIRVDRQTIYVGVQYAGEIVTVLLEDEWFRVLFRGRPIAVTPRQHRPGAGDIHGTVG